MKYQTLTVECKTIRVSILSGAILFSSNPPGADIYLIRSGGGLPVYTTLKTPNTISDLPIGDYDYILKLVEFEDYTGTIMVNENETTIIMAELIPIPKISPMLAIAGTASVLGLLLVATSKSVIPITTGKLGGEIVTVKL